MNCIIRWRRKNSNVGTIYYTYNPRKIELPEKSNKTVSIVDVNYFFLIASSNDKNYTL